MDYDALAYASAVLAATLAAACLPGGTAVAADNTAFMGQFQTCLKVGDPKERLACFDGLGATLEDSQGGDNGAEAVPETATGAGVPGAPNSAVDERATASVGEKYLKQSSVQEDRDGPSQFTLASAKKDSLGRWVFYFENGQIWRQAESGYFPVPANKPVSAVISSGALGSHTLRLGGAGKQTKVKRLK